MEPLLARFNELRARFAQMELRSRIGVIAGIAALVAVGVLGYAQQTSTRYEVLFANLAPEDAARIVERLREMRVEYRIGEDGTTLLVPEAAVHESRLTLAAEGLPSGGGVGFELFDRQRFGESEFSEQVQFRRALEGELSRTIRHLSGVESARVHLVLPQRTLFATQERGASASVALRLRPGFRLSEEQVRGIVHLVAGSVRDLTPEQVTIVDGAGRTLSHSGGEDDRAGNTAEELRERIELSRAREVQQLLDAALGVGRSVVDISADVTFAREERVEETYDPDRTATRSFQIIEEGGGAADPSTQGVPGAVSALPGGAPAEPTTGTTDGNRSRTEIRNFEITKVVRRAVEPVGRIQRLSVAVVVDGTWEGEAEARHFVPRTDEEMTRIRAIVTSAAGIIESRGDSVAVECMPFVESEDASVDEEEGFAAAFSPLVIGLLAVIALLGIAGLVFWLRRRRADATADGTVGAGAPAAVPPGLLAGGEADPGMAALVAQAQEQAEASSGELAAVAALSLDDGTTDPEELRKLSVEVARAEPQIAARVIRAWLLEETST